MIVNGTDILYMDSIDANYIKEFDAIVVDIRTDEKERKYIVLDRTAFYPEGGGQPTDTGHIRWMNDGGIEENIISIHRVSKKKDIRHYPEHSPLLNELQPGTRITASLDWENRYAYMRMHTSQHLVSSIFYDVYGSCTVGNQIHADHSRIDFSPLSHDQVDVENIQAQCNEIIRVNPPIKVFFEKRSVVEEQGDAERCNVQLIPDFIRELRIVKIQDVELCPCAGTHIRNLGEAGAIKIEAVRSKGKGKVRITYSLNDPEV